jgi:cytochrome o ubiquinol oxidase subunit III
MDDTKVFGFWIYLMTDLVIFAALFATFIVLRNATFGGPSGHTLFELPTVIEETLLLLSSSFTCSLATLAVHRKQRNWVIFWFLVTFVLGAAFLFLEIREFSQFIHEGAGPERSAFLSSFFILVGTHGFHITLGLLWMIVALFRVYLRPLSAMAISQIFRLAFFWHFLDLVWVFIFTVVYSMGILS